MADQFDYVIVGAGTAGCVLANRLTACGTYSVCLLEAGPPDWNPMIHIPAGFMKDAGRILRSIGCIKASHVQAQMGVRFQCPEVRFSEGQARSTA